VREFDPRLIYEAILLYFFPAVVSALIRETGSVPFCTVLRLFVPLISARKRMFGHDLDDQAGTS